MDYACPYIETLTSPMIPIDPQTPPHFSFDPEMGGFQFFSRQPGEVLAAGPMAVVYRLNGQRIQAILKGWQPVSGSTPGPGQESYELFLPQGEIYIRLTLRPGMGCWKLGLKAGSQPGLHIERLELLRNGRICLAGREAKAGQDLTFFENGWQSWSYSAAYPADQPARRTNLGWLYPGVWNASGTPQPRARGRFGADFYGVLYDRSTRSGWVAGFLSQRQQFGSLEADLRGEARLNLWANADGVLLPPEGWLETDWAVVRETSPLEQGRLRDPLADYLELVADENQARVPGTVPAGWCSWYHYFHNLSAADVEQNLAEAIKNQPRWPLGLIQVDDGFEARVGEWDRFSPRFPEGIATLAQKITNAGMLAGIWLAPFILQPQAETARKHPDWMIQDGRGRPRFAGFNWNCRTVALDLTHPQALAWVQETIRRAVAEWGFPYLKLDFLYAGGLAGGRHDSTRTNAQALQAGLRAIREAAGEDTFLLGCGCPLGPGIGIFDAMRISADTAPAWGNYYFGMTLPFLQEPHAPSACNALHNVLSRANQHQRWWWNDPDCLLLRPESKLTMPEIQTTASIIALTGGMLLVSDDLPALPPERQEMLSQMLPPIQTAGVVLDNLTETEPAALCWQGQDGAGPYSLVALINWQDTSRWLTFDPQRFQPAEAQWVSSFWDGQVRRLGQGERWEADAVPAHGTVLLALRAVQEDAPVQYLGGTLHISQGMEMRELRVHPGGFDLNLDLPRMWQGEVRLWVKDKPRTLHLSCGTLQSWNWRAGILRAQLTGRGSVLLHGEW